jgi:hypothetical protein
MHMTARLVRPDRWFVAALIAAVLAWTGSPVGVRAAQGKQVTAFVTVAAPATGPLKTLTAKDFSVKEDNAVREVTAAELSTDPLFVAVLVTTTAPPAGVLTSTQDLRTSLSHFMKTLQTGAPEAQVSLTDVSGHAVTTVDFTPTTADLDKAILKLVPSTQEGAVMNEALVTASKALAGKPAPRRAIVSVNFNVPEGTSMEARNVAEEIHKSGASLWGVSIYQSGTDPNQAPTREAVLNDQAPKSGGMHMTAFTPAVLDQMLQSVANSLLSQYSITYARPGNGTPKKITGEVTGGAKVLFSVFMR